MRAEWKNERIPLTRAALKTFAVSFQLGGQALTGTASEKKREIPRRHTPITSFSQPGRRSVKSQIENAFNILRFFGLIKIYYIECSTMADWALMIECNRRSTAQNETKKMRAKHSDNNSSISKIEEELEMNEDVC